ncbi:MAG: RrF2 family transcriptional regulator [Oscillospiraceae bacterium]
MNFTLESDYAVRIVGCLAAEGRRMDAKTISSSTMVTLRFSLKILRKLVSAGIVRSFKGTQGGYELAAKPSEISLHDVISAIEGKFAVSKCLTGDYDCSRGMSGRCKYQRVFSDITAMVEKELKAYTFDKLI